MGMLLQRFLLLAVCLLLLLDPVLSAASDTQVIFTTNVTSVLAIQPFTAQCHIENYKGKPSKDLIVAFWRKNSTTDEELVSYSYDVDGSGSPYWAMYENKLNYRDLVITLNFSIGFPNCQVTMLPIRLDDYEYYCQFINYSSLDIYYSNHVTVAIHEVTTFTSNVSQVVAGQPFTGTCQLEKVESTTGNYHVQFWSSEGLLGTYRVYAPKQSTAKPFVLFKKTKQNSTTTAVSHGTHAAYPTFDIQISTTDASQIFWCNFFDERQLEYRSNIWPTSVFFSANVSTHEEGFPFAGRCSMTKFSPANTTYSVGFYAARTGLLATYVVRPNEPLDLVIEAHHPYIHITQGASLQLPTYELSINVTGSNEPFWCSLQIGQQQHGNNKVMEYKSNRVIL